MSCERTECPSATSNQEAALRQGKFDMAVSQNSRFQTCAVRWSIASVSCGVREQEKHADGTCGSLLKRHLLVDWRDAQAHGNAAACVIVSLPVGQEYCARQSGGLVLFTLIARPQMLLRATVSVQQRITSTKTSTAIAVKRSRSGWAPMD